MIDIRIAPDATRRPETIADFPHALGAEAFQANIQGVLGDRVVLRASRGIRLVRRGQLPLVFLPPTALATRHARSSDTLREDDIGLAVHLTLAAGSHVARDALWYYPGPDPDLAIIAGMLCVNPARLDSLSIDGQRVQPGNLPGTWIMPNLRGLVVHRPGAA